MRPPEIKILTRSPWRFAARRRIFLGLGISVLKCGSETVTQRRAEREGSLITSHFWSIHIPAIWTQYGSGTKFGRRQQRGKSIFPLRTSQSFPQRLALANLYLVIEGVLKNKVFSCGLQQ